MEDIDYVSFDVAKLLHEKRFDSLCSSFYTEEGELWHSRMEDNFNRMSFYSRPTLYDAQKWLRTKHNIHVVIDNNACGYGWFLYKADNGTRIVDYADGGPNDGGCWDSYEEALNNGIMNALKLI